MPYAISSGFISAKKSPSLSEQYSFILNAQKNGKYYFRLNQVDSQGNLYFSDVIETTIAEKERNILTGNFPNPFNPVTVIKYNLPERGLTDIVLYNIAGKMVRDILHAEKESGSYYVPVRLDDMASGVYYYTISLTGVNGKHFSETRKIILQK